MTQMINTPLARLVGWSLPIAAVVVVAAVWVVAKNGPYDSWADESYIKKQAEELRISQQDVCVLIHRGTWYPETQGCLKHDQYDRDTAARRSAARHVAEWSLVYLVVVGLALFLAGFLSEGRARMLWHWLT